MNNNGSKARHSMKSKLAFGMLRQRRNRPKAEIICPLYFLSFPFH